MTVHNFSVRFHGLQEVGCEQNTLPLLVLGILISACPHIIYNVWTKFLNDGFTTKYIGVVIELLLNL